MRQEKRSKLDKSSIQERNNRILFMQEKVCHILSCADEWEQTGSKDDLEDLAEAIRDFENQSTEDKDIVFAPLEETFWEHITWWLRKPFHY